MPFRLIIKSIPSYNFEQNYSQIQDDSFFNTIKVFNNEFSSHTLKFSLPYSGNIYVNKGDIVNPETLIGENKFEPPKIFVVMISSMLGKTLTESEIKEGLLIQSGDKISIGDKIFNFKDNHNLFKVNDSAFSPVRGIVERINYTTGTIIVREIQDYPLKPVEVNVAKLLSIKEKNIRGYMKKREGDFIFAGETLASNHSKMFKNISSPYTGTIQEVNTQKGSVKICYDKKPFRILSNCFGKVKEINDKNEILIDVDAISVEGKIGFGKDVGAKMMI